MQGAAKSVSGGPLGGPGGGEGGAIRIGKPKKRLSQTWWTLVVSAEVLKSLVVSVWACSALFQKLQLGCWSIGQVVNQLAVPANLDFQ